MQQPNFRFKQFSIWHDQCAMKVNTDGILLGAWSTLNNAKSVIDVGSGTGLIALMLAQKANGHSSLSHLVGVEIDEAAANQAKFNVAQSPWPAQVEIICQDIQSYCLSAPVKFDLLVSNPPYFTNSLRAPDEARDKARHNAGLSFEALLHSANQLGSESARFNLILPCNEAERLLKLAPNYNWFLSQKCDISTVEGKSPTRSLLSLTKKQTSHPELSYITIRDKSNGYTPEFIELCREFYLNM